MEALQFTLRWDHMGIFGYERNTTPKLAQEKNLTLTTEILSKLARAVSTQVSLL